MITYQESNLEKMALANPELEKGRGDDKEGDISEEEKVPERWYNAILPLVVLVLVSLLRMYFDGKLLLLQSVFENMGGFGNLVKLRTPKVLSNSVKAEK